MSKNEIQVSTDRTTVGLRNALFETLDQLRSGKTSARNAAAVAGIVNQIVGVTKLEIAFQRFIQSTPQGADTLTVTPLQLGDA